MIRYRSFGLDHTNHERPAVGEEEMDKCPATGGLEQYPLTLLSRVSGASSNGAPEQNGLPTPRDASTLAQTSPAESTSDDYTSARNCQ